MQYGKYFSSALFQRHEVLERSRRIAEVPQDVIGGKFQSPVVSKYHVLILCEWKQGLVLTSWPVEIDWLVIIDRKVTSNLRFVDHLMRSQ